MSGYIASTSHSAAFHLGLSLLDLFLFFPSSFENGTRCLLVNYKSLGVFFDFSLSLPPPKLSPSVGDILPKHLLNHHHCSLIIPQGFYSLAYLNVSCALHGSRYIISAQNISWMNNSINFRKLRNIKREQKQNNGFFKNTLMLLAHSLF